MVSDIGQAFYLAAHVGLALAVAVHFWRRRSVLGRNLRLAALVAAGVLCLEAALGGLLLSLKELPYFLGFQLLLAIRLSIFAAVGAECSNAVGVPPIRMSSPDHHRAFARSLMIAGICGLGFAGYTVLIFGLGAPRYESDDVGLTGFVSVVAIAPLVEEMVYRLGIQNFLADWFSKKSWPYWTAIVATSILFALGHAGAMEPSWVKLVQMVPVSLVLGFLYQRHGFESAWAAHTLFNGLVWWEATSP